jgi:hypothetical protein
MKPHVPNRLTREQVDTMAGYGVPETAIARVLKIDAKTLRKYYRDELDTAHVRANSAVAQSLFRKATGNGPQSVTAAIFWLKCRAGWKDTVTPELGKKERADLAARQAVNKAEWGEDLRTEGFIEPHFLRTENVS